MKKFIVMYCLFCSVLASAAEKTLVCKSADFNPKDYEGQALKITFDDEKVLSVEKVAGSWFCDKGVVQNPSLLRQTLKVRVYDVNFQCDEWNGRLVLPASAKIKSVRYEFTYSDDERDRRDSSLLKCQ